MIKLGTIRPKFSVREFKAWREIVEQMKFCRSKYCFLMDWNYGEKDHIRLRHFVNSCKLDIWSSTKKYNLGRRSRCMLCGKKVDDIVQHASKRHYRELLNSKVASILKTILVQQELYQVLLGHYIRADKRYWSAFATTMDGCLQCSNTSKLEDGAPNEHPLRCTRFDTSKNRVWPLGFFGIRVDRKSRLVKKMQKIAETVQIDDWRIGFILRPKL